MINLTKIALVRAAESTPYNLGVPPQRRTQTEIIEAAESYEKIKKLVSILDTMPDSKKGLSLLNYDALLAIRKVLDTNDAWDVLGDRTRFKRELKKNNFTI